MQYGVLGILFGVLILFLLKCEIIIRYPSNQKTETTPDEAKK
jgi:hypothetical protein